MDEESHATVFRDLPQMLPVFPLTGALLLPGGRLPLTIFEPRYLQMAEHALGAGRFIGMVQPTESEHEVERPDLCLTGCVGRISAFAESEGGRYLITLTGICRFRIAEEIASDTLYRMVRPDYEDYRTDMDTVQPAEIDRERLLMALRAYLATTGDEVDWKTIENLDDRDLVTSLAMACPFEPMEKQALLEAFDLVERARTLTALIEMASLQSVSSDDAPTQ
jgi:Lon protease-like protein